MLDFKNTSPIPLLMGFIDRLFGTSKDDLAQPEIRFGRYTDSYKRTENYEAWDASLRFFEEEDFLNSYRQFLFYLRDQSEDNVHYEDKDGGISFELYQGSKKICGFADDKKFKAEARIAYTESLNVAFMRRLIEKNFSLKYARFALDETDNITIIFDTYTLDGSPYKLYFALKELATNADKQDDLLLDEFRELNPVETAHLQELPKPEKEAKHQFIVDEIRKALHILEHGALSLEQYPGGYAYILLNLLYKLDFLTKPEGHTMETLERLHRKYFAKDDKSTLEKVQLIAKGLKKLSERPPEEFFKEMYQVRSTFGITTPVNHDRVVGFMDSELPNMDWYFDNGHQDIALAIPGYIVGYCLFNYAIPKPDRDLFFLYYQILEADFFRSLGFTIPYVDEKSGALQKRSIRKAIDQLVAENKDQFPRFAPNTGNLEFGSHPAFAKSFLRMMRPLDLTRVH